MRRTAKDGNLGDRSADHLPFFRNDGELFFGEIANDDLCADYLAGLRRHGSRLHARAAATLDFVLGHLGALAVALAHDDEQGRILGRGENHFGGDHAVALLHAYAAHATGGAAHLAHVLGLKADALPLCRHDGHGIALDREVRRNELVTPRRRSGIGRTAFGGFSFLQINSDDARAAHVGEGARRDPLRRALLGHEDDR